MRLILLLSVLLLSFGARAQETTVFAAASLTDAMKDIAVLWTQAGHKPPRLSFGSSSTLARQIEQGAPVNVFASADLKWMDYSRLKLDPFASAWNKFARMGCVNTGSSISNET